jgi:glycosyltransferase involved in cell wall biosynthesis
MSVHFFVPRWMDPSITNAQNSNARALLSRFRDRRACWTALGSSQPPDAIRKNGTEVVRLHRSRLWKYQLALAYQSRFDAIFYPGVDWADELGMKVRRLSGRRTPLIATIEGIIASEADVRRLADLMNHDVFSQPGVERAVPRIRAMYQAADHIVAISPFLARVANFLYGDKVSYLPLGLESGIFHATGRQEPERPRVVGCGTVKASKNPQMFLRLAEAYPNADFVWYGGGPIAQTLTEEAERLGRTNLRFEGSIPPAALADEFRKSSLFVLPSHAEGVPKVSQEAAACGLPVVLNGFYESPSVIHERNGLVAWSDEELVDHVGTLIADLNRRREMGAQGVDMAKQWDWDQIAPRWEELLIRLVTSPASFGFNSDPASPTS